MSEEKIYCYNCFKPIKEGEKTREHIPAKTLFEGYDDKYKANRITVPACYECNQEYSPTDRDFRNLIGIIAKRKENNQFHRSGEHNRGCQWLRGRDGDSNGTPLQYPTHD